MNWIWTTGLVRRRAGRLLLAAFGVSIAVALLASLGTFLTASASTMTTRAASGVAVDWQVAVRPNGSRVGLTRVLDSLRSDSANQAEAVVGIADSPGFAATTRGTTQTTAAGKVLGIPSDYATTFPGELRLLTGDMHGVLVAQQTAANLHVEPGDNVRIQRAGLSPVLVAVAGVVELPQADSLFQRVGAPPRSQLAAPPDNVLLLPSGEFQTDFGPLARMRPDLVATQVHVRRSRALPSDPSQAYVAITGAANHLEATTSGVAVVGNNLGAVLDAARDDAAYARILFLFLAAPAVALAAALTSAAAQSGATRRRREQSLLRTRGATTTQLFRLVLVEAGLVALLGGLIGLGVAAVIGATVLAPGVAGASTSAMLGWTGAAVLLGVVIVALTVVVPAGRTLGHVGETRRQAVRPRWLSWGIDLVAIAAALAIFWAAGRNKYTLVLAPEGVPKLTVNYWAFLAPALAWLGAALLGWRIVDMALGPGRAIIARLLRPLSGNLSPYAASMLSRQRRLVTRSAVLVGLALAFAASTATFNATYAQQAEVDAQLTNGADITVTESPGTRVPASAGRVLEQVSGVQAVQPMLHRFAYVGTDLQDLYGVNPKTIGEATSLQDPYFQGGTASQLLARLASRPDGVLVSAETVIDFQLSPGDMLWLRLQNARSHDYTPVIFHYVGIVNEFPTAPRDSFIVGNASYIADATHNDSVGTFLVSTGGQHVNAVADRVRHVVGDMASVTTINDSRGVVGSSLTSVDLAGLTRIELGFALVIAAAAGALVLGLGLAERRRGIALATLLGANRAHQRALTLPEPVFVGFMGVVVGALSGWALSYLLVKMLSGVFDPPPSALAVPWSYLAGVAAVVVAGIVAAAVVVSKRTRAGALAELREN